MTTNSIFPTTAQLQEFEAKCRTSFPALDWEMEGSTLLLSARCRSTVPDTEIRIDVGFDFSLNSAESSVSVSGRVQIFQSTRVQGQSLEEAIALLREFLKGYGQALNKAVEEGDCP